MQRRPATSFVVAVAKKYVEDRGSSLAALLAYYGVLSVFPLLLVLFTLLGIFFSHDLALQHRIIHSALSQFPVIGKQLGGHNGSASLRQKSIVGLVTGLLALVWGSLGVTKAGQRAMSDVWNIPQAVRPHFRKRMGRSLEFLGVLALDVVLTTALASFVTFGGRAFYLQVLAVVASLVVNVAMFLLGFRILTPKVIAFRSLLSGAAAAALGWSILQYIGTWLVGHQLRHASQLYGYFGSVLGLVSFLYLAAQITLICAEINVVKARHLYPRSLVSPPFTPADVAVLTDIILQSQRRLEQTVRVEFQDGSLRESLASPESGVPQVVVDSPTTSR